MTWEGLKTWEFTKAVWLAELADCLFAVALFEDTNDLLDATPLDLFDAAGRGFVGLAGPALVIDASEDVVRFGRGTRDWMEADVAAADGPTLTVFPVAFPPADGVTVFDGGRIGVGARFRMAILSATIGLTAGGFFAVANCNALEIASVGVFADWLTRVDTALAAAVLVDPTFTAAVLVFAETLAVIGRPADTCEAYVEF